MSESFFDQQLALSLQRLEDLWQRAESLPKPLEEPSKQIKEVSVEHRQLLKESLDEFSTSLEELRTITEELRQQNEALTTSHVIAETERQRYRELFESAPTGYIVTTKEAVILDINEMAAQLLNGSSQPLRHKRLIVFVDLEKRQDFYDQLRKLQAGESIKNWQFQIQHQHGSGIPVCCTVMPVQDSQGQVLELRWCIQGLSSSGTVASTQQFSDRNVKFDSTPHLFQDMFERAAIGMALLDRQGCVITSNQALQEMLGYTAQDLQILFPKLMNLDKEGAELVLFQQLMAGQHCSYQLEKHFPDRPMQWARLTASLVRGAETRSSFATFMLEDITSAKQHQAVSHQEPNIGSNQDVKTSSYRTIERLAPAFKDSQGITQKKESSTSLSEAFIKDEEFSAINFHFISIAAHELRNPLNTIASCAKLVETYTHQWSDEKKVNYLKRIQVNVKRIERLFDDFLLASKIETGQLQLKPALVDLTEFCHQLIQELKQDVGRDRKIILTCKTQTSGVWDKKILRQILLTLLSNAIKYSPKSSEIELNVDAQEGYVKLRIQSSGLTIPQKDPDFLLKAFHSSSNLGAVEKQGLGLAIVKKCVDLQGGEVLVERQEETGTTVTVTLPLILRQENNRIPENY